MRILFVFLCVFSVGSCTLQAVKQSDISSVTEGLCAITKALDPPQLIILTRLCAHSKRFLSLETYCHGSEDFSDFVKLINQNGIQNVIFTNEAEYLSYVKDKVLSSIRIASLIFDTPYRLSPILLEEKLGHRISLFMFYYGETGAPKELLYLNDPLRLVVITSRFPNM